MATPPSKRHRLDDLLVEDSDSDDLMIIYLSEEENDVDLGNDGFFYPSKESNLVTEQNIIARRTDDAKKLGATSYFSSFADQPEDQEVADDESCSSLDITLTAAETEELENIGRLLVGICCDKTCLRHLTATDLITCRADTLEMNQNERKKHLFAKLRDNTNNQTGKMETKFVIAGKEVCKNAWSKIYSVSRRTLSRMTKEISLGENQIAHGNQGKKRLNTKKESVVAWMERYFNLIGDKMPDNNQIHLPSWETQKDIHARYSKDMELRGIEQEEIAGISIFVTVHAKTSLVRTKIEINFLSPAHSYTH